jgi:hypothetical protein
MLTHAQVWNALDRLAARAGLSPSGLAKRAGLDLVLSPTASIRRGDRVVVKTRRGEVMVKELKRRTAKSIEWRSVDRKQKEQTLPVCDVLWITWIHSLAEASFLGLPLLNVPSIQKETSSRLRFRKPADLANITRERNMRYAEKMRAEKIA